MSSKQLIEEVKNLRLQASLLFDMADSILTNLLREEETDSSDSDYASSDEQERFLPSPPALVRSNGTYLEPIDLDQPDVPPPNTPAPAIPLGVWGDSSSDDEFDEPPTKPAKLPEK